MADELNSISNDSPYTPENGTSSYATTTTTTTTKSDKDIEEAAHQDLPRSITHIIQRALSPTMVTRIATRREGVDAPIRDIKTFSSETKHNLMAHCVILSALFLCTYFIKDAQSAPFKLLACCLICPSIPFFCIFAYVVVTSKHLHHIQTVTKKHGDFGNITFSSEIKEYPNVPMLSMSELFAVKGSSVSASALRANVAASAVIFMAAALHFVDLYQNEPSLSFTETEYVQIFMVIPGSIASSWIVTFDLNQGDKVSYYLHYVGVVFMLICIWPYAIQSDFSSFSVFTLIACYLMFILYFIFSWITVHERIIPEPERKGNEATIAEEVREIKKRVHRISVICLLLEMMGCLCVLGSVSLYIWNINAVQSC
eukprot:62217_1